MNQQARKQHRANVRARQRQAEAAKEREAATRRPVIWGDGIPQIDEARLLPRFRGRRTYI